MSLEASISKFSTPVVAFKQMNTRLLLGHQAMYIRFKGSATRKAGYAVVDAPVGRGEAILTLS